jgi:hypothetical protein
MLEIAKEVLRAGRCDHGDDSKMLVSASVDLAPLCTLPMLVSDRRESLRPKQPRCLLLSEKPDFVTLREAFQGAPDYIYRSSIRHLWVGQNAVGRRQCNPYSLPKVPAISRYDDCNDASGDDAPDDSHYQIHCLLGYADTAGWRPDSNRNQLEGAAGSCTGRRAAPR